MSEIDSDQNVKNLVVVKNTKEVHEIGHYYCKITQKEKEKNPIKQKCVIKNTLHHRKGLFRNQESPLYQNPKRFKVTRKNQTSLF